MSRLFAAWIWLFGVGMFLLAIDIAAEVLISVRGVPALGVVGGALILLVFSSTLNWLFQEARDERNRNNQEDDA